MNSLKTTHLQKKQRRSPIAKTKIKSKNPTKQLSSTESEEDGMVDLSKPFRIKYIYKKCKSDPTKIQTFRVLEQIPKHQRHKLDKNSPQAIEMQRLKRQLIKQQKAKKHEQRKQRLLERLQKKRQETQKQEKSIKKINQKRGRPKISSNSSSKNAINFSFNSKQNAEESIDLKDFQKKEEQAKVDHQRIACASDNNFHIISELNSNNSIKNKITKSISNYQYQLKVIEKNVDQTTKSHDLTRKEHSRMGYYFYSYNCKVYVQSNKQPEQFPVGLQSQDPSKFHLIEEKLEKTYKKQPELSQVFIHPSQEEDISFKLHSDIFDLNTPRQFCSKNYPLQQLQLFGSPQHSKAHTQPYQFGKISTFNLQIQEMQNNQQNSEESSRNHKEFHQETQWFDDMTQKQWGTLEKAKSKIQRDEEFIKCQQSEEFTAQFQHQINEAVQTFSPVQFLEDYFSSHDQKLMLLDQEKKRTQKQNYKEQVHKHNFQPEINIEANFVEEERIQDNVPVISKFGCSQNENLQYINNQQVDSASHKEQFAIEVEQNGSEQGELVIVESKCTLKKGHFFFSSDTIHKEEESDQQAYPQQVQNSADQEQKDEQMPGSRQIYQTSLDKNEAGNSQKSEGEMSIGDGIPNLIQPIIANEVEPSQSDHEGEIVFCQITNSGSPDLTLIERQNYEFMFDYLRAKISHLESTCSLNSQEKFDRANKNVEDIQKSVQNTRKKDSFQTKQRASKEKSIEAQQDLAVKCNRQEEEFLALFDSLKQIEQSEKKRREKLIKHLDVIDQDEMRNTKGISQRFWHEGPLLYDPEQQCFT